MKTYTNGNLSNEVYYRDNIEIRNNDVIVNHSDGRVVYTNGGGAGDYQYYLKDHLGNVRLTFTACPDQLPCKNANLSVINENHYYPFGMKMEGDWNSNNIAEPEVTNQYNGKEWVDDLGLAMNDYGARWYDPAVARWSSVDPVAEKYVGHSPYNYVLGNPVGNIDPDGRSVLKTVGGDQYRIDDQYGDYEFVVSQALFNSIVSNNPGEGWYNDLPLGAMLRWKLGIQKFQVWNSDGIYPNNSLLQEVLYRNDWKGDIKGGLNRTANSLAIGANEALYRLDKNGGSLLLMFAPGLKNLSGRSFVAKGSIQLSKTRFGHTFTTHGQEMTNFLVKRASGSGMTQGQFLDNQKAAQFILENLSKTANGAVNVPIPKGFPARVISPNGTFKAATHIRLIPGGKGVKSAYPVIP